MSGAEPAREGVSDPARRRATGDPLPGAHRAVVLVLIAWWGFGNLYEAIVVMPWLWRLPPGSLPGEFEPGSPVLYFMPAGALLLVLVWALVIRGRGDRRAALRAAVLITVAAAGTGVLVGAVNPTFRDPAADVSEVHAAIMTWEAANLARLVLAGAAAHSLLRARSATGNRASRDAGPRSDRSGAGRSR
ncbi:hypothetical protein [Bailinhaonella thermotolerans]|uniref:DUF4149 domain-containing protein n=1 Tax=Bailinhaonella thermotolerans TaxID=1070861 RepID=A0A3A4ABS6_9ACTN|nr:hypothetical protein [Bailinhaonella thermotolerans]RJL23003.1 hypothetical protein D5H75_34040 [Bailinhaonella thermotolerans]